MLISCVSMMANTFDLSGGRSRKALVYEVISLCVCVK